MPFAGRMSRNSFIIVAIIAGTAIILAAASYEYSRRATADIVAVAARDIQSNAKIQVHDISRVLVAKLDSIDSNLRVMSENPVFERPPAEGAAGGARASAAILGRAQSTTSDLTEFYMWLDDRGRLVNLSATGQENVAEQYAGTDLSGRAYFVEARNNLSPPAAYYSTAILSNDGIPRMYVSFPVVREGEFRGVLAAGIRLETLGKYLQGQLSQEIESSVGMLDRQGIILYSTDPTAIGKDVFGEEFQARIPDDLKPDFNGFLRRSLAGGAGAEDISYGGVTRTLAYKTVTVEEGRGQDFGVVYIVAQHRLAGDVLGLIDAQRNFSTAVVAAIGAVAVAIAVLVLSWNRRLERTVRSKTAELEEAVTSLRTANEQLESHDRMQKEFINIAAHELRTPIQPIILMTEMLAEQAAAATGGGENGGIAGKDVLIKGEDLMIIKRNAERLNRLSADILDVTRIESRMLKLDREPVDLGELAAHAVEDARRRAAKGAVEFLVERKGDAATVVEGDRGRLEQVISNLVNNAAKFTESGSITVTVSRPQQDVVQVAVRDTGQGIDPEIMPRLFQKFASKAEAGGTGLGLFISKNIVEAHGGKIWAENNSKDGGDGRGKGRGATFAFTLPAPVRVADADPPPEQQNQQQQ
ncbi:MAG: sensor histidine kinase [Thermoproteota archaeon]